MKAESSAGAVRQNAAWQLIVIGALLLGFALRLYRVDAQALSADEAFSIVNWTRGSLDYLFNTIALIDPQPPLTLLSLYGWVRLAGDSELAARMLSVFASLITLAAGASIARHLGGPRVAVMTLLLCGIAPFQIWYAQDIRSYSLWMAVSALSAWMLLRAIQKPGRTARWAAYTITAAAAIYTFYLEGFFLIAQNLFILSLLPRRRQLLKPWIASQAGIALLLAPWFLRPTLWSSGYLPTAGASNIPWVFETLLFGETLPAVLQQPVFALGTHTFSLAGLIAVVVTAAGLAAIAARQRFRTTAFLGLYALVPIVLLTALTELTGRGYFRPRYIAAASLPLILILALLVENISRLRAASKAVRAGLVLAVLLPVVAIDQASLWNYHFGVSKAPPWREIAALLSSQASSRDVIIRNFPDPAFDYYYHGSSAHRLLPTRESTPPAETGRELERLMEQYDYLWFMPVPTAAFDAERVVARWLRDNAQLVSEQWIGPTHLLQYTAWTVSVDQIASPLNIPFGSVAELAGYRVTPPDEQSWRRGATLYVELFWEPRSQTDEELTIFVHLLGPPRADGSPLWAQDDHTPQDGRLSTRSWPVGELLRDVHRLTIPDNAPAGEYAIAVGFYEPVSGERLPLAPGIPQSGPDSATLLAFRLSE